MMRLFALILLAMLLAAPSARAVHAESVLLRVSLQELAQQSPQSELG